MINTQEHEFEAAHGLPEALPAGERMLWQGAPDWRVLAVEALHLRKIAVYFAILMVLRGANVVSDGGSLAAALFSAAGLLPVAGLALGLLATFAWLMARNSAYTLTDKRVVMRVGIVLSVTFNLPFTAIESAALRGGGHGHGDITLALAGPDRIALLHLWPHVRPWRLRRTQPMLRALPNATVVAALLAEALAQSAGLATQSLAAAQPAASAAPALHGGRPMAAA